jgi:hypothetical protein
LIEHDLLGKPLHTFPEHALADQKDRRRDVRFRRQSGYPPSTATLKEAASTIPIVFNPVNDPVGQGFVASLSRPAARDRCSYYYCRGPGVR